MPNTLFLAASRPSSQSGLGRAGHLLRDAREHDRAGRVTDAVRAYEAAIDCAEQEDDRPVLAEALRRLGVIHHRGHNVSAAREACERSHRVAIAASDNVLAAEALNALAGIDFERGGIDDARATFQRALALGAECPQLRGRIEQNLGILANIQGDLSAALGHYNRSLEAFRSAGDEHGCAIAYHNLGMISADRKLWNDADRFFDESRKMAEAIGDVHLRALCLLNHTEVFLARQRYEEARENAEEALRIFTQLGADLDKADAYKVIGVVYRETGRPVLAEARLRSAIELAVTGGSLLSEAEASRELARLYQDQGRNQDALKLLNVAHRLFGRLDARVDLVDIAAKTADLEGAYLAIVRNWGQSIESADSYTHGHCERVATYAVAVATALGLDESEQTTIRLGAYLHDVGKVRIPHEILNKPGKLTREEFEIIQMHPIYGLELLAGLEFPWDIKPIIRWHHERHDGTGYPDRLRGDEIPLGAQIICIVDVYDALTTTRSYRAAMTREAALAEMEACRRWWRADVYSAFSAVMREEGLE
ncbi:MAG TPA: tetratricopeptide repeat protein [Gemmatimonadaceae bacterium]|nr:tetratricopeptide repeat protein [Gemmatimonadaceae bacterium]